MPDPQVPNWSKTQLPDTWPDQLALNRPHGFIRLLRHIFGKRQKVQLPQHLEYKDKIPKYVLQEFHNLPNGNYSNKVSRGYITGFEKSMLGHMPTLRQHIAAHLEDCSAVLDIGCGGGKTGATIRQYTQAEVWGIDPSPYLLKHAALDFPDINFIQGVAEDLPFETDRFDGISICFVFHELSPRYVSRALDQIQRVLKPGGKFAIVEPAPTQLEQGYWQLFKSHGWQGPYFKFLAHRVHEPFVNSWHNYPLADELQKRGMQLLEDRELYPARLFLCVNNSE
ncbi:MAG: methyltransferase domain-containing protein [Kangiellaceae bacterium]|nr:methyltransferase domain-containing protein [Kangiellaceae bacterium]